MTDSHVLAAWGSFYMLVGSAAGALIGLQFVVMTLIADKEAAASSGTVSAFGTPTVVHLTCALLVSAIMSAPWPSMEALSTVLETGGIIGLIYCAIVVRRAHRQTGYQPVLSDWIWFTFLPCVAYAALAAAGMSLLRYQSLQSLALFSVAAAALGLLLIGIHNAWDTVTHIVVTRAEADKKKHKHSH